MQSKVWSVTLEGKNDCVIMTESEVTLVVLKFGNDIEITNMTERHGMKPEHLHKLHRMQDTMPDDVVWLGDKPPTQTYVKGVGPGMFGGAAKMVWEFEDLMAM